MERTPTRLRQTLTDVFANRVVYDDPTRDRRREEVLCLEPVDRALPIVGETMERVGRDEAAEQRRGLEDRPLVLRQRAPDFAVQIAGHLPAHARTGLRRERQEDGVAARRARGSLERDVVSRESLRPEQGQR